MKRLIPLQLLAHGATAILAFVLGTQFTSRPASPAPAVSVAQAPGRKSIETVSPAPATPSALSAPLLQPSTAAPAQRLARLIDAAARLNEAQTIAELHKIELQADNFQARLQRHVLLAHFAEVDPETALTYVDNLSGTERNDQAANILTTWAARDPQAAAAHFQASSLNGGFASTEDRDTAGAIAAEWARQSPSAALAWAASLPEEVRSEARGRVIASLAASNPALAAQTAATLPQGYERADVMKPLAAQWAQTAPDRAAAWVQTLASPAEQASAASGLASSWMNSDPLAASQWVSSLKPGGTRDAAVAAMVEAQSLRNDPEAATLWAASVQEVTLRQQLVATAAGRWQRIDGTAANAWLQANNR